MPSLLLTVLLAGSTVGQAQVMWQELSRGTIRPGLRPASPIDDGGGGTPSFPVDIPDNFPAGVTLTIGDAPAIAQVDSVIVSMLHTFVGDLTVRIIPPSGPSFTLFERPGLGSNPNFPEDGYPSNLGVNNFPENAPTSPFPYEFVKTGSAFDAFANLQDTTLEIAQPSGGFTAKSWVDGPFSAGTWQIFLSDSVPNDTGLIAGVSINYTAVPEPAHAALATLFVLAAGLMLRTLRQRRRSPTCEHANQSHCSPDPDRLKQV